MCADSKLGCKFFALCADAKLKSFQQKVLWARRKPVINMGEHTYVDIIMFQSRTNLMRMAVTMWATLRLLNCSRMQTQLPI